MTSVNTRNLAEAVKLIPYVPSDGHPVASATCSNYLFPDNFDKSAIKYVFSSSYSIVCVCCSYSNAIVHFKNSEQGKGEYGGGGAGN